MLAYDFLKAMPGKSTINLVAQIMTLVSEGHLSQARTLLKQHVRTNKRNPDLWLMLGDINKQAGDTKRAQENYRKVLKLESTNVKAHTSIAMLAHDEGKLEIALKSYKRSLSIDPKQPVVCFNLASIHLAQGSLRDAEKFYQKAIQLKPDYAKAYANLGYILRKLGDLDASISNYIKALEYEPDLPEIHYNLGITRLLNSELEAAEKCQNNAIQLKPNYADAWGGLGAVNIQRENYKQAFICFRKAVSYDEGNIEAILGLARVYTINNAYDKAIEVINQALFRAPDNIELHAELAAIYLSQGLPDKAERICCKALKDNPAHAKCLIHIANAKEKQGDVRKAYEYLQPLLKEEVVLPEAAIIFSLIGNKINCAKKAIDILERTVNQSGLSHPDARNMYFSLGSAYDSNQEYQKAFSCYEIANQLAKSTFDIISYRKEIDLTIKTYSNELIQDRIASAEQEIAPIFIIGMPRSGTSLVEQILDSHSKIYGAGELPYINNLALSYKDKLLNHDYDEQVDEKLLDSIARDYSNQLSGIPSGIRTVTDKMPENYLHLGFINMVFPNARIIHCNRDPLDTCLSCYFQDFSVEHPYIYDLKNIAEVYLEYQRIMTHWKQVLNIQVLDVTYEELITDQEQISREMVEFCGFNWEEQCLDFYNNKRFVWTASYDQVRTPIYKHSAGRWRNYHDNIEILVKMLS